jgi:hypothetical protein
VQELAARVLSIGQPDQHPWRGIGLEAILPAQLQRLLERIERICLHLTELRQMLSQLAGVLVHTLSDTVHDITALQQRAARIASAPELDSAALGEAVWLSSRADIQNLVSKMQAADKLAEKLAPHVQSTAFDAPVETALATLQLLPDDFPLSEFDSCHRLIVLLPKLNLELNKLNAQLGQSTARNTLAEMTNALVTAERVAQAPHASPEVFAAAVWDNGIEQASVLAETMATLEVTRTRLSDQVLPLAWDTDTSEVRSVLGAAGGSWLRVFSGKWRRARATARALVRDPTQAIEAILVLLETLATGQEALRVVRAGANFGRAAFGADWQEEFSRSAPLRALVAWMRSLHGLGASPRIIASRLPNRDELSARATRLRVF